jgi:hypothetical protein
LVVAGLVEINASSRCHFLKFSVEKRGNTVSHTPKSPQ